MEGKQTTPARKLFIVTLIIVLCSCISGWMNTGFGHIEVTEVTYVTDDGRTLSGHLFVPENATMETPAPAIVSIHGYTRTSESEGIIALELARRGFVVFNIDMYGHGESENGTSGTGAELVDALNYLTTLRFVDTDRLGATGHSNGGRCIDFMEYWEDNSVAPKLSALFFAGWDPAYKNADGEYYNKYGDMDVGMLAATYDDFFYTNGTTNPAREFLHHEPAKSFVSFGDPASFSEDVVGNGEYYTQTVDGRQTTRVIYLINGIHVFEVFTRGAMKAHVAFFSNTLGAPVPLADGNQIGQLKEIISGISYLMIPFFLIYLTLTLLNTSFFSSLKTESEPHPAEITDKKAKLWFWGTIVFVTLVSFFSYNFSTSHLLIDRYNYQVPMLGLWGCFGGIATLVSLIVYYHVYAKKNGLTFVDSGLKQSPVQLVKTILLALAVVGVLYGTVCGVYYLFGADFRIWFLGFKKMQVDRFWYALRWSLLYMVYYVMNSISVNCFKFNSIGGKGNILLLGLTNIFSCIAVFIIHYGCALITGYTYWFGSNNYRVGVGWLFSTVLYLFVSPIVSREIYRKTANPYIGGIINAIVVCMLGTCQTMIGYPI